MNKPLLLKLADVLDTVDESQFDYSTWASGFGSKVLGECGTTGCALGWATKISECNLSLHFYDGNPIGYVQHDPSLSIGTLAAVEAFDLTPEQANCLFLPGEYYDGEGEWKSPEADATASEVASFIREFVAAH